MSQARDFTIGNAWKQSNKRLQGPNEISEGFGYFVADIISWFVAGQLAATSLSFFVPFEPWQIVFLGFTLGYITFLFIRRWKP